ncbi:endonuclease/exonuclease/phosphatase family protein [Microlunatus flavus]|uniref:Endonuclease/Exonuclease/phosphatase family protein n=1 Tax=Microlunatus flavus TaxID=1036181 RepID=A0A1H9DUH3_9ACTN|nr:endonuclease/exonuclease/phosphatase family protein [Microlunatus flavus]SEQ16473.1 Endonuclease/Exonuclease/phosphatase family protein [Microlunatus flavus]
MTSASTPASSASSASAATSATSRARRAVAALAGAVALAALTVPAGPTTSLLAADAVAAPVVASAKPASAPLRVATYNIRNANSFDGKKNEKRWEDRRGAVVAAIKGQDLDVLAVQEATQGMLHDAESERARVNQYEDLVNRLGGAWQVTNEAHYNCANSGSPNRCAYRYTGASEGNRILYDADRVDLVDQGSRLLPVPAGKGDNYMTWAELRQRSTGKRFMVSNLHTVGTDAQYKTKNKQARLALAELKENNSDDLPMIALGDWNSSRFEKPSNGPYDTYVKAGFVDPLGGAYKTHKPKGATVEHRIRTWLNSSNPKWSRKAPGHKAWGNGSYIDYILTTPMRVSEWETVAKLDKKGRYKGVIPSDHNMVRATVWLP